MHHEFALCAQRLFGCFHPNRANVSSNPINDKLKAHVCALMETSQDVFFITRHCISYGAKYVNVSHKKRQVKQSSLVSQRKKDVKEVTGKMLMLSLTPLLYIMKISVF